MDLKPLTIGTSAAAFTHSDEHEQIVSGCSVLTKTTCFKAFMKCMLRGCVDRTTAGENEGLRWMNGN